MDIKAFIRELLFEHECVIIPDFGGFIGNYSPAHADRVSGTFYPPVRKISFNRNLRHNDGLLISRISMRTGLNYSNARSLVEEFSGELNRRLAKGEKLVFDHIGSFMLNHERNIQFEPEKDANYLLDSYGLETFQCLPVKDYDVRKRIMRHIDREPVRHETSRKILWRAAVIIPLLAILAAVPFTTNIFRTRIDSAAINPLVTAEFENNKKAVDEAAAAVRYDSLTAVKSETEPVSTQPASEEKPAVEPSGTPVEKPVEKPYVKPAEKPSEANYVIITGSFKSQGNAMSHVRELKAEGFDPVIEQAVNGFFRVYAMKCNDLETALHKKDSISHKFPGSWISKR